MTAGIDGGGVAGRLAADLSALDAELAEIDLLITQATAEAERHEQKRATAAERLSAAQAGGEPPAALLELATALVSLTRRAAVMEAQVEVLTGKRKVLGRYREALGLYAGLGLPEHVDGGAPGGASIAPPDPGAGPGGGSRVVLAAQEELRREIARAMHDGPAQSLTNIVLQAQIVERIVERDPQTARAEVRQLVDMVQRTLDATKSFIFEVRPMVLDDLGLVPTIRGASRDRARRSGIPVLFESFGPDRRLPTDLESGLFRLLDDILAAYLQLHPAQLSVRLDWGDHLDVQVSASAPAPKESAQAPPEPPPAPPPAQSADLPPALAAMIAQQRDDQLAAIAKSRRGPQIVLPAGAWEELRARADTLGLTAELADGGSRVQLTVDLPTPPAAAADQEA